MKPSPQEKFKAKQRAQSKEHQSMIDKRKAKEDKAKTAMQMAFERAQAQREAEAKTDAELLEKPIQCRRSLKLHMTKAGLECDISSMPGTHDDELGAKLWIDPRAIEAVGKVIKNKIPEFRIMIAPMKKHRHHMAKMLQKLDQAKNKQPGEQHERKEVVSDTSMQQVST